MTDRPLAIRAVIIDCADLDRLADFWSQLLGRRVERRPGPYVRLVGGGGPMVVLQRVDAPKAGKNRVHLDLSSPDPAAECRRVEELGGRFLPEYAQGGFLVLADPEGNEFCVLPQGPFDLDAEGRAHYLDPGGVSPARE